MVRPYEALVTRGQLAIKKPPSLPPVERFWLSTAYWWHDDSLFDSCGKRGLRLEFQMLLWKLNVLCAAVELWSCLETSRQIEIQLSRHRLSLTFPVLWNGPKGWDRLRKCRVAFCLRELLGIQDFWKSGHLFRSLILGTRLLKSLLKIHFCMELEFPWVVLGQWTALCFLRLCYCIPESPAFI